MRYKATFGPQQVLGESRSFTLFGECLLNRPSDPVTYAWDALDADMLKRLSVRRWVSMSLEREWAIAPTSCPTFMQSSNAVTADFQQELKLDRKTFAAALEYIFEPEEDLEQQSRRYATVFQAEMPGVMSLKSLQDQIDLGQWGLRLGNQVAKLEVRQSLQQVHGQSLILEW